MDEITRTVVLSPDLDALRLRSYRLAVEGGKAEEFRSRRIRIGSDTTCDLVINDASASRVHCEIVVDGRGYRVNDLGSKNGTRVQGVTIASGWIRDGQTLQLGSAKLLFSIGDEEIEIPMSRRGKFGELRGTSEPMREVFGLLERVAPTDTTLLVEGESGTGKELAVAAVHTRSQRAKGPLVVLDCSAIAPDLVESEIFGHVKGAFTGADQDREGAFERASGGTLFLDEIGELSIDLQPRLLRALESRTVRRVGGDRQIPVDVRVVAATNRSLREAVHSGEFREDLYYRLAVIRVVMPPLRERPEDIPVLVRHFMDLVAERTGRSDLNVSFATMEKLQQHAWPGNVRELRNYIERAAVLAADGEVDTRFLTVTPRADRNVKPDATVDITLPFKESKQRLVENYEKSYWLAMIEHHDGNISAAARDAGVHRKSAEYIVRKLGLR